MSGAFLQLRYVQFLDSAFPIGSFSHSFGLETFVQDGTITTLEQLEQYLRGQVNGGWLRFECLMIKEIYDAIEREDEQALAQLNRILIVQRLAKESRDGMVKMGKRLVKLAQSFDTDLEVERLEQRIGKGLDHCHYITVHAWVSHRLGVSMDNAVLGFLYTSLQNSINSALRLMSMGQTQGQQLLHRMIPYVEQSWMETRETSEHTLSTYTLAQEIRAMQHDQLYSRLFMS